jgi:glycosyltransferase involved in cell wall biosynthesis
MPAPKSTPLRGLYIARLDLSLPHHVGVANKIRAQLSVLRSLPAEVDLVTPEGASIRVNDQVERQWPPGALWRRLNHTLLFYRFVAQRFTGLQFAYIRHQKSSPALLWMLHRLHRRNPGIRIFLEVPTYPYRAEGRGLKARLLGEVDRLCNAFVHRWVDHVVTFSRVERIFGVPTLQTDNGVDVDALSPVRPAEARARPFRIVAVANLAFWHGYDRVIAGMAIYRNTPGAQDVVFDIVGAGSELARLQADARRLGLQDKVRFLGVLQGQALTDALQACHLAVSCIGVHRVDRDSTDLKSREYCARGIPFVNAYADRDFGPELGFFVQMPPNDDPLDIEFLMKFIHTLSEQMPEYPQVMRSFAADHLIWSVKLRPVVADIEEMCPPK